MKIKRFIGSDSRSAMRQVKEILGPEAIILSNRSVPEGIEILAAEDFDDELLAHGEIDLANAVAENIKEPVAPVYEAPEPPAAPVEVAPVEQPVAEPPSVNRKKLDWLKSIGMQSTSEAKVIPPVEATYSEEALKAAVQTPELKSPAPEKKSPLPQAPVFSDALKAETQQSRTTPAGTVQNKETTQQMHSMREELMQLRGMMESQLSSMNVGLWSQSSPTRSAVHKRLLDIGITETIATKLVTSLKDLDSLNPQQAVRSALTTLARHLHIGEQSIMEKGGVVVLLGPAGAGKTTTIAKMALQYSQEHSARDVVLISTDNSRVGAHEQLAGFGKLLGVPVLRAIDPAQIQEMIRAMQDKALVLVDTGSLTQMDLRDPRRIPTLNMGMDIDHYLVMPATTQFQTLHRIIQSMPSGSLKAGIVSKVDEASNIGEVLSASIGNRFPLSYWTEKQTITSKLQKATQRQLVEQAVGILKSRHSGHNLDTAVSTESRNSSNGFQIQ